MKHPDLIYLDDDYPDNFPEIKVVVRRDYASERDNVALVTSGGSKEHLLVNEGILTAVAYGDSFSCPSPESVLAAIRAVTGGKGCSCIVKNNHLETFRIAAEQSIEEGFLVDTLSVKEVAEAITSAAPAAASGSILQIVKDAATKPAHAVSKAEAKEIWAGSIDKKCFYCGEQSRKLNNIHVYNNHMKTDHRNMI